MGTFHNTNSQSTAISVVVRQLSILRQSNLAIEISHSVTLITSIKTGDFSASVDYKWNLKPPFQSPVSPLPLLPAWKFHLRQPGCERLQCEICHQEHENYMMKQKSTDWRSVKLSLYHTHRENKSMSNTMSDLPNNIRVQNASNAGFGGNMK